MIAVLGLDPGMRKGTAWAYLAQGRIVTGVLGAQGTGSDSEMMWLQAQELEQVLAACPTDIVAVETQFGQSAAHAGEKQRGAMMNAALRLAALRGGLTIASLRLGKCVVEVAPREAKKRFTGNGEATKAQIQTAASMRFGVRLREDEADAAAIAWAASIGVGLEDMLHERDE